MKKIIKIVLSVLLFLVCAWGAVNSNTNISQTICPSPLCDVND